MTNHDREAVEAKERQRRILGIAFIASVMLTFAIAVVALALGYRWLGVIFVVVTLADLWVWRVILRRYD